MSAAACDSTVPLVGRDEPADELEQRRLAAAARPDDRDDLAGAHAQRHARRARSPARRRGARGANVFDTRSRRTASRSIPVAGACQGRLSPRLHRSLRGHYPTGSKGLAAAAAYLSRANIPAPLVISPIHGTRGQRGSGGAGGEIDGDARRAGCTGR